MAKLLFHRHSEIGRRFWSKGRGLAQAPKRSIQWRQQQGMRRATRTASSACWSRQAPAPSAPGSQSLIDSQALAVRLMRHERRDHRRRHPAGRCGPMLVPLNLCHSAANARTRQATAESVASRSTRLLPGGPAGCTSAAIAKPTSRQAIVWLGRPSRRDLLRVATPFRPRPARSVSPASSRAARSATRPAPPAAPPHPPHPPRRPADAPCSAAT